MCSTRLLSPLSDICHKVSTRSQIVGFPRKCQWLARCCAPDCSHSHIVGVGRSRIILWIILLAFHPWSSDNFSQIILSSPLTGWLSQCSDIPSVASFCSLSRASAVLVSFCSPSRACAVFVSACNVCKLLLAVASVRCVCERVLCEREGVLCSDIQFFPLRQPPR